MSSPYASGEAEYKTEHSKGTSSSQVTEYLVTRYIVRKVLLQADTDKLSVNPQFSTAIIQAVKDNEDTIQGYYNVIKALDRWGYYIPVEFKLGGVIYATTTTKISDFSEAESNKEEFNGSFKAAFDGIGGGAPTKMLRVRTARRQPPPSSKTLRCSSSAARKGWRRTIRNGRTP
jgi:hypothetical protein